MVSRWMENGNMKQYIKKYGGVNRLELVSLMRWKFDPPLNGPQLKGVTRGLAYLHNNEVVHGDLKSVRGTCPTILLG